MGFRMKEEPAGAVVASHKTPNDLHRARVRKMHDTILDGSGARLVALPAGAVIRGLPTKTQEG